MSGMIQEARKNPTETSGDAFEGKVEKVDKKWEQEMAALMIQEFGLGEATVDDRTGPLYEVKPCPGKGKGLFARHPIRAGTEIFRETFLLSVLDSDWLAVEAGFMLLSAEKKARFMNLRGVCKCIEVPCLETTVTKIWGTNSFDMLQSDELHVDYHGGVFEIASRSNHSCFPNAVRGISDGKHIWFRAVRNIAAGEEITNDYQGLSVRFPQNRDIRRMISSMTFRFWCECIACAGNLDISNLRRKLNLNFSKEDMKRFDEHTAGTSVIGRCNEEEITRMHEVRDWSINLDRKINRVIEDLTHLVHSLTQNGDLSFSERKDTVRLAIFDQVRTLLEENNKYHLDQYVLNNYARMKANDTMRGMVAKICAAEANYRML